MPARNFRNISIDDVLSTVVSVSFHRPRLLTEHFLNEIDRFLRARRLRSHCVFIVFPIKDIFLENFSTDDSLILSVYG